jgi:hypothetical protein
VDDLPGNLPDKPAADASPKEKIAYKLATDIGKEIYRLRKCTVEPVIGIIKEIMGFRQFSLRGLENVAGEWCLVCLAFNLKPCTQYGSPKCSINAPVGRSLGNVTHEIGCLEYFYRYFLAFETHFFLRAPIFTLSPTNC